ncbi:Retrovirus-related Pol polyprotein from transposon TNT 1-94 [Eumeta japonica]|uniref:Retrovirus-related Pol polyprotein from transposon TNT 1-94 n=1 Tax=Eumeta variegata TaxID=151549 RepID=A0A4C1X9X8_EUMVA|nr:Retrovirus-related Pol polyprotein from transposon TNT 1-94 [Eumeta japonica]
MSECNPVKTPGEIQKKKTNYLINKEEIDNRFYREVIGALMYLVVGTRPDIANTVSRLAQFVNEPCQQDWLAVKRILRLNISLVTSVELIGQLHRAKTFFRKRPHCLTAHGTYQYLAILGDQASTRRVFDSWLTTCEGRRSSAERSSPSRGEFTMSVRNISFYYVL